MVTVLYDSLQERYPDTERPDWYHEAVQYLRGGVDEGLYGLYLYHLISECPDISTVINIGTARGHSAVCAAKGIADNGREGVVHTIDLIAPDEAFRWHVEKHPSSDPLAGSNATMEALIRRFHDPDDDSVPIKFHTGNSSEILAGWDAGPPDLVFHDGEHTYDRVITDVRLSKEMADRAPISVFDDCYLFHPTWEYHPFTSKLSFEVDRVPKIGGITRRLRQLSMKKTQYYGIQKAVADAYESGRWARLELVDDEDHAPMAALLH